MQVTDFDGSCRVQSADELLARLRSVRWGDDGAFVLDHGGPESLWLHVKGDAAFVWFCLDPATGRAGFVPDGMWAGERQAVRFRLVSPSDGDTAVTGGRVPGGGRVLALSGPPGVGVVVRVVALGRRTRRCSRRRSMIRFP